VRDAERTERNDCCKRSAPAAMPDTTKQELLRKAALLMGREQLAASLKVPVPLLDAWISGHAAMPDRQLIILADILDRFGRPEKG